MKTIILVIKSNCVIEIILLIKKIHMTHLIHPQLSSSLQTYVAKALIWGTTQI